MIDRCNLKLLRFVFLTLSNCLLRAELKQKLLWGTTV